ncbi:alcohol oxidase [Daedaleopsis nitida]|nr:alcohol oxidase [Daedaleopsis nitida]
MPTVPELSASQVGSPFPNDGKEGEPCTYDYIIVGGGTAGCVLASRLSENPAVSVLVIEQGPVTDTWASRVPVISGNPYRTGTVAKTWWSLPMQHADNRYLEIMRGEALGGTSRINSLLYTRGSPGDYNRWEELGMTGWGYADVERFFIMSEKARDHPGAKFRGHDGVWHNRQFPGAPYTIIPRVHDAFLLSGIAHYPDLNAPDMPACGTGLLDVIQDDDFRRHSVNRAFLPATVAQARKDRLKICTNTLVTRIQLTQESGRVRAAGVHFESTNTRKAGQRYYACARKEIILCAGAVGSPHLLMLSGLGPKEHLSSKGIPVIRDMPAVGSFLQDHVGVPLTYEVPMTDSLHQLEASPLKAVQEAIKYLVTSRGLLSFPFQASSTFVASRLIDESYAVPKATPDDLDTSVPENRPDIEIMHLTNNATDYDIQGKGIFTLLVAHIRPQSYGSVRLATINPRAHPDVDLGFFTNPDDYIALRKGIRLAMRVAEDIRAAEYPLHDLIVPEDSGAGDERIDAFVRANLRTCFHYTSTCRMGHEVHGDRPSVVDTELRVHGVSGLRVCDASVFPEIVGAHTMAPTVMVAEKCASIIKGALGDK